MDLMNPKPFDLARLRRETPGCTQRNHLNNAGAALMPASVRDIMIEHLRLEADVGGYEAADLRTAEIAQGYENIASLLNAASRNVAVVANATAGFIQALSSFELAPGDVIVTSRCDYTSNQIQYLALKQRRGIVVRHAADHPEGGIDPQSLREIFRRERCRLAAITWIPTNSGLVQDVEGVGRVCSEFCVPYLIDACQAVGQIPIDVKRLRCDYLSATARKFLRGPRGVGFLYASDAALERGDYPLFIDMRGARWVEPDRIEIEPSAQRYEDWEFPYALVLGQAEAARYASQVGIDVARDRAKDLASRARDGLNAIDGVRTLDRGRSPCAIVTVAIDGWRADDAVAALREVGINTSASLREYAVYDFDKKGVTSAVRISPHYYNSEEEIDQLTVAVAELVASKRSTRRSNTPSMRFS